MEISISFKSFYPYLNKVKWNEAVKKKNHDKGFYLTEGGEKIFKRNISVEINSYLI